MSVMIQIVIEPESRFESAFAFVLELVFVLACEFSQGQR